MTKFHGLNRRFFLRSGAVCIGLPLLDAMLPIGLRAGQKAAALRPKRILLMCRSLGLHTPYLFPEKAGQDYESTRYLKVLEEFRQDFTLFSGMSHLGYGGGHHTDKALLTGISAEDWNNHKNTISLDQEIAARVGSETRFASLVLGDSNNLSWNRRGMAVPGEGSIKGVFKKLFIDGTPAEVEQEIQKIATGNSILDGVRNQARGLSKSLSPSDRRRLDLMLTSIREAEQRLQQDEAWVRRPKPKVSDADAKLFAEDPKRMIDRERQWFDLVHLALQTDSTRAITVNHWSHQENLQMDGITLTHHDASHHGQDETKLQQLAAIEEAEMKLFAGFLAKMKATDDGGRPLLDQTLVLHASHLGNASSHSGDNLPIILAGGGFKHAGHVAFDRKNNAPLSNLFVSMLQQMGIEADKFGASTGAVSELGITA
ncbi:MAG: hypothetical protein JWN70_6873 [Planctomycetaceae bacterium]|nr:hypothetical protein [Planctomycetaceae bacterium]